MAEELKVALKNWHALSRQLLLVRGALFEHSRFNPCINNARHVLLMHGFGTLNALIQGYYPFIALIIIMSRDMRFPTMWYVQPAKAQTSLRIRAV